MKNKHILISVFSILLLVGIFFYFNQTINLHVVFNGKKNNEIVQNYAIDQKATHCYGGSGTSPNEDCLIKTKIINVWKINKEKNINNTSIIKGEIDAVKDL